MTKTNKKKHLRRLKNAILRSQTVWNNKRGDTIDEMEHFSSTGKLYPVPNETDPTHVVRLKDPRDGGGLKVACTCGWEYGPEENPLVLGRKAHEHSFETGHVLRGRAES